MLLKLHYRDDHDHSAYDRPSSKHPPYNNNKNTTTTTPSIKSEEAPKKIHPPQK